MQLIHRRFFFYNYGEILIKFVHDFNTNMNLKTYLGAKALNSSEKVVVEPLNCEEDRGGCEHMCQMRDSNINCFCFRGFRLNPDAKTCTGTKNSNISLLSPFIYSFLSLVSFYFMIFLNLFRISIGKVFDGISSEEFCFNSNT